MHAYLPFILVGLTNGSAYALAALGLTVTYKTSGLFNFAHGAIGMAAAAVFYSLSATAGLPAYLAVILAVVVAAPLFGLLIDRVLLRRSPGADATTYIVVTLGLGIVLEGIEPIIYGGVPREVQRWLPTSTVEIGGVFVGWDQIVVVGMGLVAALGLRFLYMRTLVGLNTRAVVDNRELARLEGVDTEGITTLNWMLGCAFAGLTGVILVPLVGLAATTLTLLVAQAYGAAMVGRLKSLPGTYFGALALGVGAALLTKETATLPSLAGLPVSLPYIVLFIVPLLAWRKRESLDAKPAPGSARTAGGGRPGASMKRILAWSALAAILALGPFYLSGVYLFGATASLAFVVIFASLYLLVGVSRQVSLCHAAFAGIGVVAIVHLQEHNVPYLLAMLLAGAAAMLLALAIAVPAVRLSGIFLGLATFGFGLLVQYMIFPSSSLGFSTAGLLEVKTPTILSLRINSDHRLYWFVLVVSVLVGVVIWRICRSRLGRFARALADSERAVESLGIRPSAVRVMIFCLSAFFAAIGGVLLGAIYTSITPVLFSYSQSLIWVVVLVTVGYATFAGPPIAALVFAGLPAVFTWSWIPRWQPILFGLNAIVYAQSPDGIIGSHVLAWEKLNGGVTRMRSSRKAEPPTIGATSE